MKYNLIILMLYFACGADAGTVCGDSQSLGFVRIPQNGQLLSLEDIVGNFGGQLYILLPNNNPFDPDSNYQCTVTELPSNEYLRVCTGLNSSNVCVQFDITLTATPGTGSGQNKALFTYNFETDVITEGYWSSCPEQYIWRFQCVNYEGKRKCPPENTRLSVFVRDPSNLGAVPLNDIVKDLFTRTGVKFGLVDGMEWFYTNVESTPCVVPP